MAQTDMRSGTSASVATRPTTLNGLDWLALVLLIVGGLNWGLVGAFDFDLVATLFGSGSMLSRVVYILVGLAAIYGFILIARLAKSPAH